MQDVYILHSLSEHISDGDEFDIEKLINSGTNLTDELQLASHVATYDASSGLMVIHLDPPVYASSLYVARRENETLVVEEIYIFACKPPGKMMMMIVVHLQTDLSPGHASNEPSEASPWRGLGGSLRGHKLDTGWQGRLVHLLLMSKYHG